MKERPILFSAPMIRALLDGTKTQTRRVAKLRNHSTTSGPFWDHPGYEPKCWKGNEWRFGHKGEGHFALGSPSFFCPYGVPGDRLWVKETHHLLSMFSGHEPEYLYRATDKNNPSLFKWTPSIFMPRSSSRLTLEITDVRVERLQEISRDDCYAEGIERPRSLSFGSDVTLRDNARNAYRTLWEFINGAGSWDANPWVWAITFRRVKP